MHGISPQGLECIQMQIPRSAQLNCTYVSQASHQHIIARHIID